MEHPILFLLLTWMDSGPREGKALAQRHTTQRAELQLKAGLQSQPPRLSPLSLSRSVHVAWREQGC